MKRYIVVLFLAVACSNGGRESGEVPVWFYEVKPTSGSLIYGTGSSSLKEDAINNALSSALAVIKTNVRSTIQTDAQIVNGKLSESMSVQVASEVERFSLSGYEVKKLEYVRPSKTYYAEVVIDKDKIYKEKLEEYNLKLAEIKEAYSQSKGQQGIMGKLHFAKPLNEKVTWLKQEAGVLRALNSAFNYTKAIEELNFFANYRAELIKTIRVGFQAVKAGEGITSVMEASIRKKKIGINKNTSNIAIVQDVEPTSYGKIYGVFFAKTNIVIEIKDDTNQFSHVARFMFGGTSAISEKEAYKESLKDLSKQFDKILEDIL